MQQIVDASALVRPALGIEAVNDFVVKFANVNGSGSASANGMFAKSILRMGVPIAARNIFPSNIQGLPTWFEVRVSEAGHLGRRGGVDLMVAMNPQTWDKDVASIEPGGYLFHDSTKPLPHEGVREDIVLLGVPLTALCNAAYSDPRQRQLFKNIIYVGALAELVRHRSGGARDADRRAVQGQGPPDPPEPRGLGHGPRARRGHAGRHAAQGPPRRRRRRPHLCRGQQRRGARRGLWRRQRLRLVPDHAVDRRGRGLHGLLRRISAPTPTARRATPSSRPRTRSPRSASSSAPAGTARAPSPARRDQASP